MFNNLAEFVRRLFGGGHTLELLLAVVAVAVVAFVWRARYLRAKPGGAPYSGWKFSELKRGDATLEAPATNGATPHYAEPEDEQPVNPPLPELRITPTFVADPEPVQHQEPEPEPEAVSVAAALTAHDATSYVAHGTSGSNGTSAPNGTSGANGAGTMHHASPDAPRLEAPHEFSNGHANGYPRSVAGDGVPVDDTIVFPTGRGFGDFRRPSRAPKRRRSRRFWQADSTTSPVAATSWPMRCASVRSST
jgi:hypothetical protein